MITIGMNYDVLEGKEDAFEHAFRNVVNAMKKVDGHEHSRLYRAVDDGGAYLIISRWRDKETFDAFIASDAFRSVTNWGREQILAGRPTHHVYADADSNAGGGHG